MYKVKLCCVVMLVVSLCLSELCSARQFQVKISDDNRIELLEAEQIDLRTLIIFIAAEQGLWVTDVQIAAKLLDVRLENLSWKEALQMLLRAHSLEIHKSELTGQLILRARE